MWHGLYSMDYWEATAIKVALHLEGIDYFINYICHVMASCNINFCDIGLYFEISDQSYEHFDTLN